LWLGVRSRWEQQVIGNAVIDTGTFLVRAPFGMVRRAVRAQIIEWPRHRRTTEVYFDRMPTEIERHGKGPCFQRACPGVSTR
jgi:hypothetical protein